MNEDKSARYNRLVRRARAVEFWWSAAFAAFLIVSRGSVVLRNVALSTARSVGLPDRFAAVVSVFVWVALFAALHECVSLPLAYYRTHLLEKRYGLAAQSATRWLWAYLRGALVAFTLAQAAAYVLYACLRQWPHWWWVPAAVVFSLAIAGLATIAPIALLPMFYKIRPVVREELRRRLLRVAEKARATVLDVCEWTVSDVTRKANAALVGLGRSRRILLTDTLLADFSDDEVEVVIAHELAHQVHGDIWRSALITTGLFFAACFIADYTLRAVGPLIGVTTPSDIAGLPLLLVVFGGFSLAVLPFANAYSRAHERRADRFALDLTQNPAAFTSAVRRLARHNLAEERPSWLIHMFFYNHPPVVERLQIAEEWRALHRKDHLDRTINSPRIPLQPSSSFRLQ